MEETVVLISREAFRRKATKLMEDLVEHGGPTLGLASVIVFTELENRLFDEGEEHDSAD